MSGGTVDFNNLGGNWSLKAEADEHPEERVARIAEETKKNDHARFKDKLQLFTILALLGGGAAVLLWIMIGDGKHLTDDMRGKAETALFALITGAASFVGGKAIGKKESED